MKITSLDGRRYILGCMPGGVSLEGITITNGYSASFGGGVLCSAGLIRNCIVVGNSAPQGGGIYGVGSAVVRNCLIHHNAATLGGGGGRFESGVTVGGGLRPEK